MVNIVNLALIVAKGYYIFHCIKEIFRTKRHLIFVNRLTELTIQSESADLAKAIAVRISKFLLQESPRLLFAGRITRSHPHIKLQTSVMMTFEIVLETCVK